MLVGLACDKGRVLVLHALAVEDEEFLCFAIFIGVLGAVLENELASAILLGSIVRKAPVVVVLEGDPGVRSGDHALIDGPSAVAVFKDNIE